MLVEKLRAPGLSGYGAVVENLGVVNFRIPEGAPVRGVINPVRSNHLYVVRWHLESLHSRTSASPENWWPWIVEDASTE